MTCENDLENGPSDFPETLHVGRYPPKTKKWKYDSKPWKFFLGG